MSLSGTLIVLATWLAFIWFYDPDGFRAAKLRHAERTRPRAPR